MKPITHGRRVLAELTLCLFVVATAVALANPPQEGADNLDHRGTVEALRGILYTANINSNSVSVVDLETKTISASIAVGVRPHNIAFTPDAKFAYITNTNDGGTPGTVSVIDAQNHLLLTTIDVGNAPTGVAATPDGRLIYVPNSDSNTVSVIRTATNTVIATIDVGGGPEGVAITPDGKFAYVTSFGGVISVIDTTTNTVPSTFRSEGMGAREIAFTPDGALAYVTHIFSNNVSVIDTNSRTVVASIRTASGPNGIAFRPGSKYVYAVHNPTPIGGLAPISIIDTTRNTLVAQVPIGQFLFDIAFSLDGSLAYVTGRDGVYVVDTATTTVIATIPVTLPHGIAVRPVPVRKMKSVPFASLTATAEIRRAYSITRHAGDSFEVAAHGKLGRRSNGIVPDADDVTVTLGSLSLTIPAGSFARQSRSHDDDGEEGHRDNRVTTYRFKGVVEGVSLQARIEQGAGRAFRFHVEARHANLGLIPNPLRLGLAFGDDRGRTLVRWTHARRHLN